MIAVLTITYREGDLLESVILNWQGLVDKHLILEAKEPWQGPSLPWDNTVDICKKYEHVEYNTFHRFRDEAEQRNWGLGRLYDYDYVLIVDADELFTEADQRKILNSLGKDSRFFDNMNAYRAESVKTYFKTPDYILSPPDTHEPIIAVNPKKMLFDENRSGNQGYAIPLSVTMHHASYLRSDERIITKLKQFMHYDQVKESWYEDVWSKWNPEMEDVRAYGKEKSGTVEDRMPIELTSLL